MHLADLIQPARLRASSQTDRHLAEEMLSDHARIVASSAFRRLQSKAQVFSLEQNASVRTRLTHSLEVSMFGELIGRQAHEILGNERPETLPDLFAFLKCVQNACLLHDIGNPPFGHLGEYAIREWFTPGRIEGVWSDAGVPEEQQSLHLKSFKHFDGNAQGLRIVSKLQWLKDPHGLNLTCSLLAAYLKYLDTGPVDELPFRKKAGFFEAERGVVASVWRQLGLGVDGSGQPEQRHPITFIMEAADDIAYCLSDIEDAIHKRLLEPEGVLSELTGEAQRFVPPAAPLSTSSSRSARFLDFRFNVTRHLTKRAAEIFAERIDDILKGSFPSKLFDVDTQSKDVLKEIKQFASASIFRSREAVDVELSGYRVVSGLMEHLSPLLRIAAHDFEAALDGTVAPKQRQALESRLASLLPHRQVLAYRHATKSSPTLEPVWRTHLLVDFVSGMTDPHALKVYKIVQAIDTGVIS